MASALYICYFGLREPLVQTQVLPYLRELVKGGHDITLLTFEPKIIGGTDDSLPPRPSAATPNHGGEFLEEGIEWHWLTYHKWPSAIATAYDVFRGAWLIRRMISKKKIEILHGRVHIPTLMGAIARKFSRRKPRLLFDIRGFFPEEYTDAGVWPEGGWLYRSAKRVELWLLKESDGFVVLTEKARDILFPESAPLPPRPSATPPKQGGEQEKNLFATAPSSDKQGRPVEVIPCCVEFKRFETATAQARVHMRRQLGVEKRYVLAYVGAFGGWYLTRETADLYGVLKIQRPDAFALILTQSKPDVIEPLLRDRGFADGDYLITRVPSAEIPKYLSAADAAVSFIKQCYSKQASSPTKNAEYLACGLPIIANAGVGDVDALIDENNIGALISGFDDENYLAALSKIESLGEIGGRCREVAKREFDLETVGAVRYRRIYDRLLGRKDDR